MIIWNVTGLAVFRKPGIGPTTLSQMRIGAAVLITRMGLRLALSFTAHLPCAAGMHKNRDVLTERLYPSWLAGLLIVRCAWA